MPYLIDNKIDVNSIEMGVIVQEMYNSEISGIAFTVNPLTRNDKEIVAEIAEGQGENIVSGRVNPEKYIYNWFEERYDYNTSNKLLKEDILNNLMRELLKIQVFSGYPCDIKFAYEACKLYILQARPITKIVLRLHHKNLDSTEMYYGVFLLYRKQFTELAVDKILNFN